MNKKPPNRYFSKKQEKFVSDAISGKVCPNSGATDFKKGDVYTEDTLYECKTSTTLKESYTVHKKDLIKNHNEAFSMGKPYSVLVFNFGPSTSNYYILDEKRYKELIEK